MRAGLKDVPADDVIIRTRRTHRSKAATDALICFSFNLASVKLKRPDITGRFCTALAPRPSTSYEMYHSGRLL